MNECLEINFFISIHFNSISVLSHHLPPIESVECQKSYLLQSHEHDDVPAHDPARVGPESVIERKHTLNMSTHSPLTWFLTMSIITNPIDCF